MKKPELVVFKTKAETLLNEIKKNVHDAGAYSGFYGLELDEIRQNEEKKSIFNKFFKFSQINFDRSTLTVSSATIELPIDRAKAFFRSISYNAKNSTIDILRVVYQLKYTGDLSALELTCKYAPRTINAEMNGGGTLALFFYHTKPVAEVKDEIKAERDTLIDLLEQNQKEVYEYFVSKKQEVINSINIGYQLGLEKARKQKEDNDSLL